MSYATATLADLQRIERLLTLEEMADEMEQDDTEAYIDRTTDDDAPVWDVPSVHLHVTPDGMRHLCCADH